MTGVPAGYWAGKFIAVCDPDPSPTRVGPPGLQVKRLPGQQLITPEVATERAIAGLQAAGLYTREGAWQTTLQDTRPGRPLLVQRLDHPDSFYYIVPIERQGIPTSAAVRVDARFGNHLGSIILPASSRDRSRFASPLIPLDLSQEAALESIVDRRIDLGRQLGQLRIRRDIVTPYSTLVWKPCQESLSPYYPFYM